MEALLAEVERKRKQVESCEVTSKKKYFRRGELAAKQADDYKKKEEERLKKKGLLKEKEREEADRSEYIRYAPVIIIYMYYKFTLIKFNVTFSNKSNKHFWRE